MSGIHPFLPCFFGMCLRFKMLQQVQPEIDLSLAPKRGFEGGRLGQCGEVAFMASMAKGGGLGALSLDLWRARLQLFGLSCVSFSINIKNTRNLSRSERGS